MATVINKEKLIELVLAGSPAILIEIRSFKVDPFQYRDKKTGAIVHRIIAKYGAELGDAQMQISDWLPDGTKVEDVKPAFAKGEKAVLILEGMEPEQGFFKAKGKLYPYSVK